MLRSDERTNAKVLALLAAERGAPLPVDRPQLAPTSPVAARQHRGSLHVGDADVGGPVDLDLQKLMEGRLLVQGASGAGKSWTLRRVLEQTAGQVQHVVIDPEGEFRGIADAFGHLRVEAHQLDTVALVTLAHRVREHRLSLILDFSDLERAGQMIAVSSLLEGLIDCPAEHWHSTLVVIDEAHLFAPFGGHSSAPTSVRNASIAAVTDLMSRGRKRGLAGVLATQRLNRLAKSVISEAHNYLIGLNTLDLDIRRAAETIGWDARRAFDRLPMLEAGDFVAVGPAFSRSPAVVHVGAVRTEHRGAAPRLAAPAPLDAARAAHLIELDALTGAATADAAMRAEATVSPGLRAVRGFIRDPGFAAAGRVWGALLPLAPEGAGVSDLAAFLDLSLADLAAGLALLDLQGVVEFSGEGAQRAVRIEPKLAKELKP